MQKVILTSMILFASIFFSCSSPVTSSLPGTSGIGNPNASFAGAPEGSPLDSGQTRIYYLPSSPNTFIHYTSNSKDWTTSPGVKVSESIFKPYRYITLSATQLEFVFNNGAGVWDNPTPGKNYITTKPGIYTIAGHQLFEGEPVIKLYYQTGWEPAFIDYSADAALWTYKKLDNVYGYPNYRYTEIIASNLEFALSYNRQGHWDNNVQVDKNTINYFIKAPGTYRLQNGIITTGAPARELKDSVSGKVTSSNGAAIPGAKIALSSRIDSEIYQAIANADGTYFSFVKEGVYDMTVTASSFNNRVIGPVTVLKNQETKLDVIMTPLSGTSSIHGTITVKGSSVASGWYVEVTSLNSQDGPLSRLAKIGADGTFNLTMPNQDLLVDLKFTPNKPAISLLLTGPEDGESVDVEFSDGGTTEVTLDLGNAVKNTTSASNPAQYKVQKGEAAGVNRKFAYRQVSLPGENEAGIFDNGALFLDAGKMIFSDTANAPKNIDSMELKTTTKGRVLEVVGKKAGSSAFSSLKLIDQNGTEYFVHLRSDVLDNFIVMMESDTTEITSVTYNSFNVEVPDDEASKINDYIKGLKPLKIEPIEQDILGETKYKEQGILVEELTAHTLSKNFGSFFGLSNANPNTLFPGAMISGQSLYSNILELLPIPGEQRKNLSIFIKGVGRKKDNVKPVASEVNKAMYEILEADYEYNNEMFEFTFDRISSEQDLKLKVGGEGSYGNFKGSFDFGVDWNQKKERFLMRAYQEVFTVTMDQPTEPSDFFQGDLKAADLKKMSSDENPPVFINSVTYGEAIYVLYEFDYSNLDLSVNVQASYDNLVNSASTDVDLKFKKMMETCSVSIRARGGFPQEFLDPANFKNLDILKSFKKNLEHLNGSYASLVPLSYGALYLNKNLAKIGQTIHFEDPKLRFRKFTASLDSMKCLDEKDGDITGSESELYWDMGLSVDNEAVAFLGDSRDDDNTWDAEDGETYTFSKSEPFSFTGLASEHDLKFHYKIQEQDDSSGNDNVVDATTTYKFGPDPALWKTGPQKIEIRDNDADIDLFITITPETLP